MNAHRSTHHHVAAPEAELCELMDLPTVVDIEYDDGELMTHLFDQTGTAVGFWYRDHDTSAPGAALHELVEVSNHPDQRLVNRIQRCRFVDGSSPLVALGIAHRYVEAIGDGEPCDTLTDITAHYEILHHCTIQPS